MAHKELIAVCSGRLKKSTSAFYPLDPQKKIRSDRPHFTRCSIRRSACPHFTGSHSSCILTVLLYACETWTLTKSDWKRLESFHLHCQRRILGIKWSDLSRMPRFTPDRVCRVSSQLFAGAVSHCSATLRVCQIMYRPKQFCTWYTTSETEFHPSQTGADHGAVLPSPGCTRFVQTMVWPLKTLSTAPRIRPCGGIQVKLVTDQIGDISNR